MLLILFFSKASTISGGPVGGQTRVTLRNDHLQYIFTWYVSEQLHSEYNVVHTVESRHTDIVYTWRQCAA